MTDTAQDDGALDGSVRFERRMNDSDALLWRIEKDPLLRSTIVVVGLYDRPFDRARLVDRFDRATRLIPRLRQRAVAPPLSLAPPRWEADPRFDLSYHVRQVRVPGEGSLRDLLDMAQPLAMQGFDRARPLWEFTAVDGLTEGRAALILKVHHSVTDGIGAMQLLLAVLLDLERDPSEGSGPMPEAPPPEPTTWFERAADAAGHERRRALGIARRTLATTGRLVTDPSRTLRWATTNMASTARLLRPVFTPLSPIMQGRSLGVHFDALTMPLDELKAAGKKGGGTLNDAFVAAVAGGLHRYHEHHGAAVEALRMTMLINVRTAETASQSGNQFSPARFRVPVGIADPAERIGAVRSLIADQRAEPSLGFTEAIAGVLNRLGTTAATELFGRLLKSIDFLTSNVPGPPIPVYFAGARLEGQFAYGPLSGAGVNITLLSYLDECQIGVNTDAAAVPDPDVFMTYLGESFDEVRKLA